MRDRLTKEERSARMALIRSKDTKVEARICRELTRLGYKYSKHASYLPGKPDVVFRRTKKAIFVNGCFWHGHKCRVARLPKSHVAYWVPKIEGNRRRDQRTRRLLRGLGWRVLVIWECKMANSERTVASLKNFLA